LKILAEVGLKKELSTMLWKFLYAIAHLGSKYAVEREKGYTCCQDVSEVM
jgi:hypothetical protein